MRNSLSKQLILVVALGMASVCNLVCAQSLVTKEQDKLYQEKDAEVAVRAMGAVLLPPGQQATPNSPETMGDTMIQLDFPAVSKTGKLDLRIRAADMPGAVKVMVAATREKQPVLKIYTLANQKKLDMTVPVEMTRTGSLWVVISMAQGPAWYIRREVKLATEKW